MIMTLIKIYLVVCLVLYVQAAIEFASVERLINSLPIGDEDIVRPADPWLEIGKMYIIFFPATVMLRTHMRVIRLINNCL